MPDRTGIFLGWSANLSNFLGLGVEAGASPMYPQKMRVHPLGKVVPPKTLTVLRICPRDARYPIPCNGYNFSLVFPHFLAILLFINTQMR